MNFLIILIGFAIMIVVIKYRRAIHEFTGNIGFAERYVGGGTVTFYVLLGILAFVLSLMYALGTLQGILEMTVGRFF
jgi:hypothetical protein